MAVERGLAHQRVDGLHALGFQAARVGQFLHVLVEIGLHVDGRAFARALRRGALDLLADQTADEGHAYAENQCSSENELHRTVRRPQATPAG